MGLRLPEKRCGVRIMTPADLNRQPERWPDVPQEFYESLLGLQEKLFPGFPVKL